MRKANCKKKESIEVGESEGRSKLDQPLTLGAFLDGLDRFYEGKIAPSFAAIDVRFNKIDAKFEEIDRRFEVIEHRFEEIDNKFNETCDHIDGLYKKCEDLKIEYIAIRAALDRIEKYIQQDIEDKKMVRQEINRIKADILSLTARLEELEKKMAV